MKLTLLKIGIQQVFLQLIQHPSNGFHGFFSLAFSIDENIIEIYNKEDIELLRQDLIDIVLKRGWNVSQAEKYYLVLEVIVIGPGGRLLFVAFLTAHPMVGID